MKLSDIVELPVKMDANEWFILGTIAILLPLFFWLPKRIPTIVTAMVLLLNSGLARATDMVLSSGIPYNLYNYNDSNKTELFDELLHLVLYPLAGYIVVYGYVAWRSRGRKAIGYIAISSIASTIFEYASDLAHVFTYKNWNFGYSLISYIFIIMLNIWMYWRFMRWNELYQQGLYQR